MANKKKNTKVKKVETEVKAETKTDNTVSEPKKTSTIRLQSNW